MRIGIDVDDTLAKTVEYTTPFALEHDKKLRNTGIVHAHRKYLDAFDWTEKELLNFRTVNETTYKDIPPIENAAETLKKLKEDGHELYIITARNINYIREPYEITKTWLDKHEFVYDKILVSSLKKGEICGAYNIDIMIDDSFGQASYIAQNNGIPVLMPVDKFNIDKECPGIIKVKTWQEIYDFIKNYKKD